jgi:hypothetical protein
LIRETGNWGLKNLLLGTMPLRRACMVEVKPSAASDFCARNTIPKRPTPKMAPESGFNHGKSLEEPTKGGLKDPQERC